MTSQFKRNHQALDKGSARRKGILLIAVVLLFMLFVFSLGKSINFKKGFKVIPVTYLDENRLLIYKDTTSFDLFASKLVEQVQKEKAKHKRLRIYLYLPRERKIGEIKEVVQIITAYDLRFEIKLY